MAIFSGVILVFFAVVLAGVDWFLGVPAPDTPTWPRWFKLFCAIGIALVGLGTIFEGYFRQFEGIEAYRDGKYRQAIASLETTINSPFKSRQALDYLALAWKKRAERATIPLVKQKNFLTSIDLMVTSINEYPCSPRAHNNLVNIFRRTEKWVDGKDAIEQLIDKLEGGYFSTCSPPVPEKNFSTYYVTMGNFYVDEKNPEYSIKNAMKFYNRAARIDANNRFVILNVPPRLLRMAEISDDPKQKLALVQRAYDLSKPALKLRELEDRAFAMVNIVDVLTNPASPHLKGVEHNLKKLIGGLEKLIHSVNLDDETWLVVAKANIALCDKKAAARNLRLARSVKKTYAKSQIATLDQLTLALKNRKCAG